MKRSQFSRLSLENCIFFRTTKLSVICTAHALCVDLYMTTQLGSPERRTGELRHFQRQQFRSISSLFVTFNTLFIEFLRVTFRQNSQKMPTVIVIVKNLRLYVTISGSSSFPVAILDSQAMINDANFKLDFCSFLATGTGNFCGETVDFVKNNRKMKYFPENIAFCLIFLLDKVTGLRKHGCGITGARARPCPDSRPSVRITPLRHFAASLSGASVLRREKIVPRLDTPLIFCDCNCY